MSNICAICGKGRIVGNNVPHSKKRTRRVWKPNLIKSKTLGSVCSKCLRTITKQKASK